LLLTFIPSKLPALSTPKTFQLSEFTSFIRRVFALNLPEAVWITAELGQANTSRGHCWLTLVQKAGDTDEIIAQLDGVVWSGQLRQLQQAYGLKLMNGLLQDGMSVRLKVTTSFHARYGLRVVVEDVDPTHTIGELERKRQETLTQLAADGLLDKNASLPLPMATRRLAVISSNTAAGLADFREQLESNAYGYKFKVQLFPAAMQGAQTGPEILKRLRQISTWDAFDVVVIVRGGGGRTDLAAFDDEDLARAVANYHLPVVVGIGHETDESVLDRVAGKSLKTPTATAVYFIDQLVAAEYRALQLGRGIARLANQQLSFEKPRLERISLLSRQLSAGILRMEKDKLGRLQTDLKKAESRALDSAGNTLDSLARLLAALRPEATLARGYALVSQNGKLVTKPEDVSSGTVDIQLRDGKLKLEK
jgi:exodeoxyribonuclease VII large subunit